MKLLVQLNDACDDGCTHNAGDQGNPETHFVMTKKIQTGMRIQSGCFFSDNDVGWTHMQTQQTKQG